MDASQLRAAVQTVVKVVAYFEELQRAAAGLSQATKVEQRGYFTPDEEQRARGQ